ncbi:MAG TPA: hypothetical protein P5262_01000 [Candidatus Moranbacteria bacterium]|nr:hypothetical protein [Candidatus Moranbacteria bacterium]
MKRIIVLLPCGNQNCTEDVPVSGELYYNSNSTLGGKSSGYNMIIPIQTMHCPVCGTTIKYGGVGVRITQISIQADVL